MPSCTKFLRAFVALGALAFSFSTAAWSEDPSSPHSIPGTSEITSEISSEDQSPVGVHESAHNNAAKPTPELASLNQNSTSPAPPQSKPPEAKPAEASASPGGKVGEKIPGVKLYNLLQKKSVVFPDIAASEQRLSSAQKFQLFVDNSASVHSITWAALGAAFGQADNSPTGFEQGWDAYGKRFGASMARTASGEFFGTFILSSAMHLDPRFYPEINPTFAHAAKYSIQRVFVMRNDDGRDVVAWPALLGPLMSEGLANAYFPDRNRTVGDTLLRFGIDLTARAGGNMVREYWPVLYRKIRRSTSVEPNVPRR